MFERFENDGSCLSYFANAQGPIGKFCYCKLIGGYGLKIAFRTVISCFKNLCLRLNFDCGVSVIGPFGMIETQSEWGNYARILHVNDLGLKLT